MDRLLESLRGDASLWVHLGFALAGFLLVTGIFQLFSRRENASEARSRRLRLIARGASTEEVLAILKPRDTRSSFEKVPYIGSVPKMMRQAGLVLRPSRFFMICAAVGLCSMTLASIKLPFLPAAGLGAALGLLGPMAVLDQLRKRRLDNITTLLPDALDQMARGLRVGHPLNTSIASVAREMPDPIGSEFGIIADQISYGDDLVDAVQEFARRVDLEDVHYLSASIAIQHGTGGDLAAIVDTLGRVVRDRIALRRKAKAISAEGRLTAYFLTAVPFLIFGMTMITNPNYYWGVRNDPLFVPMFVAIVVLVAANAVILNKLAKIRY